MVKMKLHPVLGIMVRSDGMVIIPAKLHTTEHWTKGAKDADGYMVVGINYKRYKVHRLVCETFHENPLNKPCVDHRNGNREDNDVDNLRWATVSENALNKKNNLPNAANLTKVERHRISNKNWKAKKKLKETK